VAVGGCGGSVVGCGDLVMGYGGSVGGCGGVVGIQYLVAQIGVVMAQREGM
jgi:hypothetical protein